jgi:transcriptional regulator with XRE-family HTH domain
LKSTIGGMLYNKRCEYNLSQEVMAEKCCISTRQYCDLENCKRLPRIETFLKMAIICELDLNIFVKDLIDKGYEVVDKE